MTDISTACYECSVAAINDDTQALTDEVAKAYRAWRDQPGEGWYAGARPAQPGDRCAFCQQSIEWTTNLLGYKPTETEES